MKKRRVVPTDKARSSSKDIIDPRPKKGFFDAKPYVGKGEWESGEKGKERRRRERERAASATDPTEWGRAMRFANKSLGDELPSEVADSSRPLDGIPGMDATINATRRFLDTRDGDYYRLVSPFNYREFARMGGPHFLDSRGIMYRLADRTSFGRYSVPDDNLLLRERVRPIGDEILSAFRSSPRSKRGEVLWFARPKGRTSIPFPPRGVGNTNDTRERITFLDPETMIPRMVGEVGSDSVFRQKGFAVGYLYVDDFEPAIPPRPSLSSSSSSSQPPRTTP
jgi:hypothetical protein